MVNASKYKIMGAIAGLGGSCYGSYELYNHYGRKPAVAEKSAKGEESELKKKSSQSVEEANPDVKQLPPEEPKKQPEQEEPQIISNVEEKPQQQTTRTLDSNNGRRTGNLNNTRYNFIDENGSIIIRDRTVGSQFKDYLITSTIDSEVWKKKLSFWEEDQKYYQARKNDGRYYTNNAPIEFNINLKQNQILEKEFQKKCSNAYSKPQGRWVDSLSTTGIRGPYNKVARASEYWSIVWKYCGKPGLPQPSGWYTG